MQKKDEELFEDIHKFNELAYKQYKILIQLDIDNNTNSSEYRNAIKNIEMIKEIIDRKFTELTASAEELIDFESYYAQKSNLSDEYAVNDIIKQDIKTIVPERDLMQLYFYSLDNALYVVDDVYENGERLDELGYNIVSTINGLCEENINGMFDIERLFEKIFAYTFLEYLNEAIKIAVDEDVRILLIKTKYNFAYIYPIVEESFLKNNNNFKHQIKAFQNLVMEHASNVEDMKDYLAPLNISLEDEYKKFASLDDEYYKDKTNSIIAYIETLLIKTYLSINPSNVLDRKFDQIRKLLVCKSGKSQLYVQESGNLDKKLSNIKKIDL